jgi:hypothetical protein
VSDATHETWRPIAGYEGRYEVSDHGRVWSLRHRIYLKPTLTKFGYLRVELFRDGTGTKRLVHCLVAEAFIGAFPPGQEVRHLDGDKGNCAAVNLAHGTPSENCLDMVRHGTHNWARKTHCPAGHEYTPENTSRQSDAAGGGRGCRECHRIRNRQWARNARRKAKANT